MIHDFLDIPEHVTPTIDATLAEKLQIALKALKAIRVDSPDQFIRYAANNAIEQIEKIA